MRESGIEVVGNIPWGTHLCQFYETKEDLIDILVPYFAEGLGNNEFCMWVTSEPLGEEEAEKAMRRAVPNFDRYLKRGQMEIVPHTEWYLKDGAFNLQRVLNAWVDKLNQALAKGYDGIRVTGNTAWLEKRDWRSFADYEEEVNNAVGKYRMMAICTYSLDKCGASEVIDVVRNHQFALIRRRGEWELIESSEFKRAKEALRESEERHRRLVELFPDAIAVHSEGKIVFINNAGAKLLGAAKPEQLIGKMIMDFVHPDYREIIKERLRQVREEGTKVSLIEEKFIRLDGTDVDAEVAAIPFTYQGKPAVMAIARDITERKQAEEKLKFLKDFNERIVDSIGDALLVIDPNDYTIISANETALKQLKLRKEDLIGKTCYETTHHRSTPCKPPHDICPIQEMLKTGKAVTVEHTHFDKDNNEICVEVSAHPLRNQEGKIVQAVHLARDIAERKRAEQAIRESQEKFKGLFTGNPEAAVYLDPDSHILDVNPRFEELFGYAVDEIKGKHINDVVVPKDKMEEAEMVDKKALEGYFYHYDTVRKRKDGSLVPVSLSAAPVTVESKLIGYVAVYKDITKRKKAEEALRRSEEQARHLLEFQNKVIDTAVAWIDLLDREGNVTLWNRAAELISGYSREEVTGHGKIWEWLYPDPKYRAKIFAEAKKIIERGARMENFETTIRCKDGTFKTISWYSNNILDQNGNPVGSIAVGSDVTERKAMERKLQEYAEHLEEMVEERTRELKEAQEQLLKSERLAAIGELAAMVGHDLRNPLQAITNASYVINELGKRMDFSGKKFSFVPPPLRKEMFETYAQLTEMMNLIDKSIEYANKILSDLRDFARTKKPELIEVDLEFLIQGTLSGISIPENVRVSIGYDQALSKLCVDPTQMRRVFTNLATNAIQAMPNGGELTISTSLKDGLASIAFQDTGVGIPKEDMEKLFTPLFTTKSKGVGLGLAICFHNVEAHGGSIDVESQEGKGSTFTVKLPVKKGGETSGEKGKHPDRR